MTRTTLARLKTTGLVPVIRAKSTEVAERLCLALFEGGLDCLEITLTVPGALELVQRLKAQLGEEATLGVGTVRSLAEAEQAFDSGAEFLMSPGRVAGLVKYANDRDVLVAPGAATPSEVLSAWSEGASLVRLFPCASLGGPGYLRALRGPFPDVQFMPAGGIGLADVGSYVRAGASVIGLGTALADPQLLQREGDSAITALAERYLRELEKARGVSSLH